MVNSSDKRMCVMTLVGRCRLQIHQHAQLFIDANITVCFWSIDSEQVPMLGGM